MSSIRQKLSCLKNWKEQLDRNQELKNREQNKGSNQQINQKKENNLNFKQNSKVYR